MAVLEFLEDIDIDVGMTAEEVVDVIT